MKIGELLLRHRWVGPEALASAVAAQASTPLRLCSLLIARGAVTFDQASRALGEQLGVAALLHKHLARRDRSLESRIPTRLARARYVLPIGHLGDGALIICARDPSQALHDELARVAGGPIVLAVAPAQPLEREIAKAYDVDIEIDVELEPATTGPARRRSALPSVKPADVASRDSLDVALAALRDTDTMAWLLDVVFDFLATRWRTAILFELRGRRAIGVRGLGAGNVRTLVIDGDELDEHLPAAIKTATPIVRPIGATHLLVVGETIAGDGDDAGIDLELLADAIAEAMTGIRDRESPR